MEAATMAKSEAKADEQNNDAGQQPPSSEASESQQAQQKEGAPKGEKSFPHEQVMKDNNIDFKNLPTTELKIGVNTWNMGMRKQKKNPSDKLLNGLRKSSIKLADTIQNYIEKDLPEKTENEIRARWEAAKEAHLNAQREEQEKRGRMRMREERERQERERQERERQTKERERLEMLRRQKEKRELELKRQQEEADAPERKVMAIINAKGKIHYKELKEILGRDIGDTVKVGNLILLNAPFTNSYKLYKPKA